MKGMVEEEMAEVLTSIKELEEEVSMLYHSS